MKDLLVQFALNNNDPSNTTPFINNVGNKQNSLVNNVTNILNAVIGVLGLICVVVMIIGGVNYMTSSGDAGKVKKAKDTILYGLIGLVVCVLAFALVNFVIQGIIQQGAINKNTSPSMMDWCFY